MAMANKHGKTAANMMVNGKEIKLTDKELSYMLMVIFMRGNGLVIKHMVMELINMLMALRT